MKQTIKTFIFATALTLASTASFAQDTPKRGNRPSPEAMMEQRANNIAKQMGLDAKTTKKFIRYRRLERTNRK